jgi:antitoxin component YwqK of YwqJK toxin-antitoxin module
MLRLIIVVTILTIINPIFALRSVQEGNLLVFYNPKNLKVKAYYIRGNKVVYVIRYYYNGRDLCIRKENWYKNTLLSYDIYSYHRNKKLKQKKYFYRHKLKYVIIYDKEGNIIMQETFYNKKKKTIPKKKHERVK